MNEIREKTARETEKGEMVKREAAKRVSGFSLEEIGEQVGKEIILHGSVYKLRRMSGFAFVLLRTGRYVIQCVYSPEFSRFDMAEESCVRVRALVAAEERSRLGWELRLLELEVLSIPAEPMPIVINQKKVDTSMENLLDYRMLTLRNEKQRAIFKIQEGICQGVREFLQGEHFTEIHSPKLVEAGAEGGANIFSLDYFGRQAYLAQSPQFYKQMMVGVYERVFEVGPVFRAEKHDTSRHLNEYTGVDFEMGYIQSFEEIMEMEERMIQTALRHLQVTCHGVPYRMSVIGRKLLIREWETAAGAGWPKLRGCPSAAAVQPTAHGPYPQDSLCGCQSPGVGILPKAHGGKGGL